jgi:predicted GIY-YIG superfamily endonuclease
MENAIVTYLLHFTTPLASGRHYIGSAKRDQLTRRILDHQRGNGARITRRAVEAGAKLILVRTWFSPDRELERRLKTNGHARDLCGVCRAQASILTPKNVSPPAGLEPERTVKVLDF